MKMGIFNQIRIEKENLHLSSFAYISLLTFPLAIVFVFTALIYFEHTRYFAHWLLEENSFVENLTFIFLLFGGIFGLKLLMNLKKNPSFKLLRIFLLVFSLFLIFVAMEEISWG